MIGSRSNVYRLRRIVEKKPSAARSLLNSTWQNLAQHDHAMLEAHSLPKTGAFIKATSDGLPHLLSENNVNPLYLPFKKLISVVYITLKKCWALG